MTHAMHEGQHDVDAVTVASLVHAQFPAWRDVDVVPLASDGTVNALFRLGDELVLRFPLFPDGSPATRLALIDTRDKVAQLATEVDVEVPELRAIGTPDEAYPGYWTVFDWIEGEAVAAGTVHGEVLAGPLAAFVTALRQLELDGRRWDGRTRGGPLADRDEQVRACLAASAALVDATRLASIWDECAQLAHDPEGDAWLHQDLMPGNLLVRAGELVAVIDLEGLCVGDPAVDLMPAWNLFTRGARGARATFRRTLAVDDEQWARGRGWAICQAAVALPYYVETNAVMADTARTTLEAVLLEHAEG